MGITSGIAVCGRRRAEIARPTSEHLEDEEKTCKLQKMKGSDGGTRCREYSLRERGGSRYRESRPVDMSSGMTRRVGQG